MLLDMLLSALIFSLLLQNRRELDSVKATLDCLGCIAAQALRAARVATDDPGKQHLIFRETVMQIPGMDLNESPAALSQAAYRIAKEISGQEDPYAALKHAKNEQALALEPELRA